MLDFRSDLLSPVSAEVLQAMASAAAYAPAFGPREDAFQRDLEVTVARLVGLPDALLLPTCTLANQIALRIWTSPGEAVLADAQSHLATTEAQSAASLSGVVIETGKSIKGHLSPTAVRSALGASRPETARSLRLVWLENTHNRAGGSVMPAQWCSEIAATCHELGARLHVDGARLWNAAVATGLQPSSLATLVQGADSVALSLNKGLGAPLGALLAGSVEFIQEAVRVQNMFGATWRPIGLIAAAGVAALQDFPSRIAADHRRARRFFEALRDHQIVAVKEAPETNLVMLELDSPAAATGFIDELRESGVLALKSGTQAVRFAFHSGIGDAELACALEIVSRCLSKSSAITQTR